MKAGTALGLLAGLGAMNAMSGKPYGGKRFTGLMDMLDGGGAGQSGDKFEGGGLLSMLGNLFMKPMQAQQNVERIASDTAATNAVTEVLKEAAKKQFDSKTVQDLAAANEDAYLQEAYGTPQVAPSFSIDDRSGPVYTPPPSYRFTPMGEAGRDLANNPAEDLGLLSQVLGANAMEAPTSDSLFNPPPTVGMTPSMSGGSYMIPPSQEFGPQGQFTPTAPSITQLSTTDFAIIDYLEKNNIPVTMENVTQYRKILGV